MSLQQVFEAFAGHGPQKEIDNRSFVKLLRDAKFFDASFTTTDADLIFIKCKGKAGRKLTFEQFRTALKHVADKKKIDVADVEKKLTLLKGPEFSGTKAEPTRFHDDKSLYTGVHQYGGPSTVDKGRTGFSDLSGNFF